MSANTVHQGASQKPTPPRAALQGHDQEVWESHKACIYRLYMTEGMKLGDVIKSIESRVSRDNTVVLHMWSNYQKTCYSNKLQDEVLLERFQEALCKTELTHGQVAPERIEVLHRYLYAAYYNASNKTLSYELASMLLERAAALPGMQESPIWCLSMQGYALTAKIRAIR
ncbi:uncharacterized protein PG986_011275 [Apiospora aurea]|uniref:Clr5 domain-containing protein n=1 Tax=Apiospora aurea TaxID=335848 RepID=A0ABR1Q4L9_9PEZI